MSQITCRNLTFAYGDEPVLAAIDLDLAYGQTHALLGQSGSGKTTLLWLLAGLLRPSTGEVRFGGCAGQQGDRKRPPFGMVFQHHGLWDHLTVEQHLHLVLRRFCKSRTERRQRVERMLDGLNLQPLKARKPALLSGGQRQRLSLARALVIEPQWLLLDEPLAHLDGEARSALLAILEAQLEQTDAGAIIATHHPLEAMRTARQAVILSQGRILATGDMVDLYECPPSVQVARALGPACELPVESNGELATPISRDLNQANDEDGGSRHVVVARPHHLTFESNDSGPAAVKRCVLAGPVYRLVVSIGDREIVVDHDRAVVPGTRGRLRLTEAGMASVARQLGVK